MPQLFFLLMVNKRQQTRFSYFSSAAHATFALDSAKQRVKLETELARSCLRRRTNQAGRFSLASR